MALTNLILKHHDRKLNAVTSTSLTAKRSFKSFYLLSSYTPWVAKALNNSHQVQHAPWDDIDGGALDSKYGLKCLHMFLSTVMLEPTSYDVITFNFGMHDINYNDSRPEEYTTQTKYTENLREIKSLLLSTGARVGFVLTTPVHHSVTLNTRVKQYNNIANNVMKEQPIVATADLYTWVVEACGEPPYLDCTIAAKQPSPHYSSQGSEYLSERIKDFILDLSESLLEKGRAKQTLLQTDHENLECPKSLVRISYVNGFTSGWLIRRGRSQNKKRKKK